MTTATRCAAVLAAVTALLTTSCGRGDTGMRVTLADDDCTYRGDTTPAAGRFPIELHNDTLRFASFGLVVLLEGERVEDLDLVSERLRSRQLARARARADVPPPFGRWIVGAEVEPSASAPLPVDVSPGTYAVLCFVHSSVDERLRADETPPPERAYAAGQLVVAG